MYTLLCAGRVAIRLVHWSDDSAQSIESTEERERERKRLDSAHRNAAAAAQHQTLDFFRNIKHVKYRR